MECAGLLRYTLLVYADSWQGTAQLLRGPGAANYQNRSSDQVGAGISRQAAADIAFRAHGNHHLR